MTTTDPILDRLAADALKKGMEIARKQELLTPVLVLQSERGRTERLLLTTPDAPPHEVMKIMLFAHRATHAAICFEGWMVELKPPPPGPERDALLRDMLAGRRPADMPRPSQHPDRFSGLTLLAQARDVPAGPSIHRQWRITEGTPRTFADQSRDGWQDMPSNFWPMFVGDDEIFRITRRYAQLVVLLGREGKHGRR